MPIDIVVEVALKHISELLHGIFDDVTVDDRSRVLGLVTIVDGRHIAAPINSKVWSVGIQRAEHVCCTVAIDDAVVHVTGAGRARDVKECWIPLDDPKCFDKVVALAKQHRYGFVPSPEVVKIMQKYVRITGV